MYSITAEFRPSRASAEKRRDGVVYYRIRGEAAGDGTRPPERNINSDIKGGSKAVMAQYKDKILSQLKLLYCVIEQMKSEGRDFCIDDVALNFRRALGGEHCLLDVIERSKQDFPINEEIATIGREFKSGFTISPRRKSHSKSTPALPASRDNTPRKALTGFLLANIDELRSSRKLSRLNSYTSLLNSLTHFAGTNVIRWTNLSKGFISGYARYLDRRHIAASTVAFYMRTLRAALNKATRLGYLKDARQWFNGLDLDGAAQGKSQTTVSLTLTQLRKLATLDLSHSPKMALARDVFMFSFYMQGMELSDIAGLTKSNVIGGNLIFRRRNIGREYRIPIGQSAAEIIKKYASADSDYLFPLMRRYTNFPSARTMVTTHLAKLAGLLDIPRLLFNMTRSTWQSVVAQKLAENPLLA